MSLQQQFQNFLNKNKWNIILGSLAGIILAYFLNKPEYTLGLIIAGNLLSFFFEYLSNKNSAVRNFTSNKVVFVIALILVIFIGMNVFTPTLLESMNVPTMGVVTGNLISKEISTAFTAGAESAAGTGVATTGKLFAFPFTTGGKGIWGFLGNFLSLGPILISAGLMTIGMPILGIPLIIIGTIVTLVTGGTAIAGIWTIFSNFKLILVLGFIIILFIIMSRKKK